VSHAIPLHTADRLERVLDALSQRVASSGDEGWLMRIITMLICRYLDHIVEMFEDLLAQIRAGTIVLPDWAYEQSAISPRREPQHHRTTASSSRGPVPRRARAARADAPDRSAAADAPNPSAANFAGPAPCHAVSPATRQQSREAPLKNPVDWTRSVSMPISLRYHNVRSSL
jgi:hypothetical protein